MPATMQQKKNQTSTTRDRGRRLIWPRQLSQAQRAEIERLLDQPIDYMEDPVFGEPDAEQRLFDTELDLPRPKTGWYDRMAVKIDSAETNQRVAANSLLTAAQERTLFLRFNYARFRAEQARASINRPRVALAKARDLLHWNRVANQSRELIAEYNLALVLAMAQRLPAHRVDLQEMIGEGNLALLRAIDKFQVSRGFKFSTYACRAILKAFSRLGEKTGRYRTLCPVEFDPALERSDYADRKAAEEEQGCADQVKHILETNLPGLSELERNVLERRFGLGGDREGRPMTLLEVGRVIGLTKERVRQIQNKSLAKIRATLEMTYLDGRDFESLQSLHEN